MKSFYLLVLSIFLISSCQPENKWTDLLDQGLTQWDSYLSFPHTSMEVKGPPVNEKGDTLRPIGLNKDPRNVFTMIEMNGENVLRISGEIYGCLATKNEYQNYHLSLQVKWGELKWPPRQQEYRDTGICYHSVGEFGVDYWLTWMKSQELQIGEGWFGDYWSIGGGMMDIRATKVKGKNEYQYDSTALIVSDRGNGAYCMRSKDYEKAKGEWNTVELICFGDKSLHIVNGRVVMALENSRMEENGEEVPLTKGKIQIQSEAAETYYKNIKIRDLQKMPKEYEGYFPN